jgi:hypothetical protein
LRDPPCQAIARVVDFEALVQIAHGFRSIIHGSSQIIGGVSQHISDGVAESGRIMQSPKPEVSIEQQFSIVQCLDVCLVDDGRHTVAIDGHRVLHGADPVFSPPASGDGVRVTVCQQVGPGLRSTPCHS